MNIKRHLVQIWLLWAVMFSLTNPLQAQFTYSTNAGAITLVNYTGGGGNVVISNFVKIIGSNAFYNKTSLNGITIPASVTNIGQSAFAFCGLTSVTIPDSVTSIGQQAFQECFSLTNAVIGNGVTNIGYELFYTCSYLKNITIGNRVTIIGTSAFSSCNSLTNVTIPTNIIVIGDYAFAGYNSLSTITIPTNVTSIGISAFYSSSYLTNVTIPASVTNIGNFAFSDCPSLTTISVATNNPVYSSVAGVLFNKNHTMLISYPGGNVGNYTIPSSVTSVGNYAVYGCSLSSVTIGDSVTSIGSENFILCANLTNVTIGKNVTAIWDDFGYEDFMDCPSLTTISVATNNPVYSSVAGVLFNKNQTTLISYPGGKVGNYTIPTNVTEVFTYAFRSCQGLTNITIPNNVTSWGQGVFEYSTNLTGVYFQGNYNSGLSSSSSSFYKDNKVIVYYLPGTTGWDQWVSPPSAVLWNPQAQNDGSFGIRSNRFGFNIAGNSNVVVIVSTCTNLSYPVWTPLQTLTLTNGSAYFCDLQWTNYKSRYYSFSFPQ